MKHKDNCKLFVGTYEDTCDCKIEEAKPVNHTPTHFKIEECTLKADRMIEMTLIHPKGLSPANIENRLNVHDDLVSTLKYVLNGGNNMHFVREALAKAGIK